MKLYIIHSSYYYSGYVHGVCDNQKDIKKIIRKCIKNEYDYYIKAKEGHIKHNPHLKLNNDNYIYYVYRQCADMWKQININEININEYNPIAVYSE